MVAGLAVAALSISSCGAGKTILPSAIPGDTRSTTSSAPPASPSVLIQIASGQDATTIAQSYGTTVLDSDPSDGWYSLQVPAVVDANQFTKTLSHDPNILAVEVDQPLSTPEASGGGVIGDPIHLAYDGITAHDAGYLSIATDGAINQVAYQQMDLGNAQSVTHGGGVTVAVLDTGIMTSHPDLVNSLVPGYNEVDSRATPDDIADGTTNAAWGHGTMVAGVIARLAPDVKIMPIRVLNADGKGSSLAVAKGVHYAVAHGAQVLNLSLGGTRQNGALTQAIRKAISAGVVVVAAAGNDGTNVPQYPAGLPNVIGVAAADALDLKAVFSDFGSDVSLVAPGVGIRSTYVNGGYATWTGTSFSAPFVSAAAVLTIAAHPQLSGSAVAQRLQATGRSLDLVNLLYAGQLGHGMVDIARAVSTNP